MKIDLGAYISEFFLRKVAGAQSYRRGMEYFLESRVRSITEKSGGIKATVLGAEKYRVQIRLDRERNELDYQCSCPAGSEGKFCKHLVAAGLAWLAGKKSVAARCAGRKKVDSLSVPQWLARQKKSFLVDLILDHADDDDDFWNWLEMNSSIHDDGSIDTDRLKRGIDNAIIIDDFIDYQDIYAYFCRVEGVLNILEILLEIGCGQEVVELAEHALVGVEQAVQCMDDSYGYMQDVISGLTDIHHRACRRSGPDRVELARRLFDWELHSGCGIFSDASDVYADTLGREGLNEYRRLAEKAWKGVRPLGPGDKAKYDSYRSRLRRTMEVLARQEGDVDALVEIKRRDLTKPSCFLEIAEICQEAGRYEDAIAWAEKGIKAFDRNPDTKLTDFLANAYQKKGMTETALDLIWSSFVRIPDLERYHKLRVHARKSRQWVIWQDRAILEIRRALAQKKETMTRSKGPMRLYNRLDHSVLVQIFFEEDDPEAAWIEAKTGGCSDALWMQLALQREKDHPEDSLSIYRQQIEPLINRKSKEAYQEAMKILVRIRGVLLSLGRAGEFEAFLQAINFEHNRKRNFMKLIEKKKWI
jgi:uncharacterized Zn finger protein